MAYRPVPPDISDVKVPFHLEELVNAVSRKGEKMWDLYQSTHFEEGKLEDTVPSTLVPLSSGESSTNEAGAREPSKSDSWLAKKDGDSALRTLGFSRESLRNIL